ncbi:MAG: hypothetical protein KH353_03060 [Clostridium sp.]|nr:hypothetical protein [Clostridium sp.]
MKRVSKKIWMIMMAVIAAAALSAAAVTALKDKKQENTAYTPIEDGNIPVAYMEMGGRQMNRLHGFLEDRREWADRGNLTVLPEDRKLTVDFYNLDSRITGIQYEIRSMEDESLIERTVVKDWHQDEGSAEAVTILPIQNLIDKEEEYILTLAIATENQPEIYYYTRIVWTDDAYLEPMLQMAETFSDNTFHYERASDLTTYLETDPAADNSSLGRVTLKNSFDQITWGNLSLEKTGNVEMELKELQGNMASLCLNYVAASAEEDEADADEMEKEQADPEDREYYDITESFTMKWGSQRIYMMDYERTMNQIFDGGSDLYSGKRIMLGISDSSGLQQMRSPNGAYEAFVANRELWMYSSADNESTRVFSFRQSETDEMANLQDYGIKLLAAGDSGTVDFLVSGYMSRGSHEGGVGVSLWRYEKETNTLTERLYLPANESSEELLMGIDSLSCLSGSDTLYLLMGNTVYSVDAASRQAKILAEGVTEENFAVSPGQKRIAWQDGEDRYDSSAVHIMNLETGESAQIKAPEGSSIRLLGFVGSDLVYGLAEENSSVKVNGRTVQAPMYALEIAGEDMNLQTRYEKEGVYITDVEIEDSRVHLQRMTRVGDSYMAAGADTLVCNEEVKEDSAEGIGYRVSEEKGRVYFVQLAESVSGDVDLKVPSKAVAEENNTVELGKADPSGRRQYYAYSGGRLRGIFEQFSDAVAAAYDGMGIVTDEDGRMFWSRVGRADMMTIRNPESLVPDLERYLKGFEEGDEETSDGGSIIDAGGLFLNQVLYFISRGYPVAAYTGDGSYAVIYGYDSYNISCLWYPGTEQAYTDKMGLNDAAAWFEANGGNGFVAFLFED